MYSSDLLSNVSYCMRGLIAWVERARPSARACASVRDPLVVVTSLTRRPLPCPPPHPFADLLQRYKADNSYHDHRQTAQTAPGEPLSKRHKSSGPPGSRLQPTPSGERFMEGLEGVRSRTHEQQIRIARKMSNAQIAQTGGAPPSPPPPSDAAPPAKP